MAIRYLKQEEVDALTAEKAAEVVNQLDVAVDELSSVIEDAPVAIETTEDEVQAIEVVSQKLPVPVQNTPKYNSKKGKR